MSAEKCCDGKCWRMGVGERWFWRALIGLTCALVWYMYVTRQGRPLERVAPEPPQPVAANP